MFIDANIFRLAQVCCAKQDIREYLNCIHIKNGKIESSDGHVAMQAELGTPEDYPADVLFRLARPVPKSVAEVWLDFEKNLALLRGAKSKLISTEVIEVTTEWTYPDLWRVFNQAAEGSPFATERLTFDPSIFAVLANAVGAKSIGLVNGKDENTPLTVLLPGVDAQIIVSSLKD